MMLRLQARGCHNINVVTPTHYSAHILLALDKAAAKGTIHKRQAARRKSRLARRMAKLDPSQPSSASPA